MQVTAVIQARMGSTRLPGKVLREVMGRPLLAYQIERVSRSRGLAGVVVATTVNPADDPVAALAECLSVPVCRGNESDVLDRYYQCARARSLDHVMRLTGDCPLSDPAVLDQAVDTYFEAGADYLLTSPAFAEGLDCEIISFMALERAWREAQKPSEREHVTLYVRNQPQVFKTVVLDSPIDESQYRITVDEETDFMVVKAVLEALYPGDPCFSFGRVKVWLDAHPEVMALNSAVVRNEGLLKSLREDENMSEQA